jgi:predicted ATP-binding protein involved in virulence
MAEAPQTHGAEGVLDESKRPVMTVYLSDMAQKLDVLEDLARKVEVLLTQVNAQFVNKKLVLDDRHELAVHTSQGERLPVSVLSSGEQHQIVLMYDLLFHVKPNTLVMIDEPELSLHMDWQERFIGNLQQIIAVTDFDVLLATHSPYIVNGHNDLLVALSAEPVATSMKQMN